MEQDKQGNQIGKQAMLFGIILTILFIRSYRSVIYPELLYEDGRQMLAYYFNTSNPATIFRFYAGYISLLPNTIGYLSTRVPIIYTPYVMTIPALLLATYCIYILSTPRYRWLVNSDKLRYCICILLALLPLGYKLQVTNLTYSLWNILIITILLIASPLPRSLWSRLWEFVVVSLGIMSHPLSIIAFPFCVLRIYKTKDKLGRVMALIYICLIVIYSIVTSIYLSRVSPERMPMLDDVSFSTFFLSIKIFLSRVVLESLIGARAAATLAATEYGVLYGSLLASGIIIMTVLISTLRTDRNHNILACIFSFSLSWAMIFITCQTRNADSGWLITVHRSQRYIYTPKFICALCILSQVLPVICYSMSKQSFVRKTAVFTISLIYLTGINIHNQFNYRSSIGEGRRIRTFVQEVHQEMIKAKNGQDYKAEHVFNRGGHWDIIININERLNRIESGNNHIDPNK